MRNGLLRLNVVAREWLNVSRRKLEKDIKGGAFGPDIVQLGRAVRVREAELTEWVAAGCPCRKDWLKARVSEAAGVERGE